MGKAERKHCVILLRQPPYGDSLARAGVDLALAMGAFEQDFDLLFMGPGVLQLLPGQDSEQIGLKNLGRALSSLPLYDVDTVYVEGAALAQYGLADTGLVVPVTVLDGGDLHRLLANADHLVSC